MTAEAISVWLTNATQPYNQAQIDKALNDWPWFVPLRLMDSVMKSELDVPEKLQHSLNLYTDHWLPSLLTLKFAEVMEWLPEDEIEAAQAEETESQTTTVENLPQAETATEPLAVVEPVVEATSIAETAQQEELHVPEVNATPESDAHGEQPIIQPLFTEDYFRFEGLPAEDTLPEPVQPEQPQTLMVMMSFSEWLNFFKTKSHKEAEEAREKSALRSMWQREKLASALEDEPEEIPEEVFQMAVSSITREDDLVSEPLAQIYERQEKWAAAAEMYQKLALKYPSKSTYFASRSEAAKQQLK